MKNTKSCTIPPVKKEYFLEVKYIKLNNKYQLITR